MAASFAFEGFVLDPRERRLERGGDPVEVNGRYLDALALLVGEPGSLISKDRFLGEVWDGVPVTDEALTQCIKTLRRQLGDDAARPRFIETVPKHGYRFIAPVEIVGSPAPSVGGRGSLRRFMGIGVAGTIGGAIAGVIGGIIYGFVGASSGMGAISVLLVLLCVTTLVALIGAAGVSFGIAAATIAPRPAWYWTVIGGAAGGLVVGGFGRLIGHDALTLLVGHSPGGITGPGEGALLGAAAGLGALLARRSATIADAAGRAAICGGVVGIVIGLAGGRLMLGSLFLLTRDFAGSRLQLDQIGQLFGERGFGPLTRIVSGGAESALFAACVVAAMWAAARRS